jgi:DNA-binding transcriptional ArsR family regulator
MKVRNVEIFQVHSDFCKMLSSPKRLMIMFLLGKKEMSVGELAESMDTALATVSQHLMALRSKQIVSARKEGQTVYYKINDPRLIDALTMIRVIILDGMKKRGEIAREIEIDPMGVVG